MVFTQITPLYRFIFLLIFSLTVMLLDYRGEILTPGRAFASIINRPFQMALNLPTTLEKWSDTYYPDDSFYQKYDALLKKQQALEVRLQRYDALQAENERLSTLLAVSRSPGIQILLAEIIEIGLDPFTHRVALNRGVESGVYLGQPAITLEGILGQVSGLGFQHSVVTLITDPNHAIPVQVQRNGLRTIAQGLGGGGRIEVPFLARQADIQSDDVLVTSGIGGRFPAGYKVAQVQDVITDANEAFLTVTARPFANIKLTREVLLLWNTDTDPTASSSEELP